MNTFCSYFNAGVCRSCDLIELNDQEHTHLKEQALRTALQKSYSGLIEKTITGQRTGFRNKAKLVVTGSVDHPVIGLWGKDYPDQGRELLACPLHHERLNQLISSLPEFIRKSNLAPYSIADKRGELKGIIAFYSEGSGDMYLRFVLRSEESVSRIKKYLSLLTQEFSDLKVVSVNIQPVPHAILEGEKEILLTETKAIHHNLGHVDMSLGTKGFVQTNQSVALKLYQTASDWVKELHPEKFAELFAGQGAFSFFCASGFRTGLGIEINPEAVEIANMTAKAQGLSQLTFQCADAGKVRNTLLIFSPDLILVNPPRRGLAGALPLLLEADPQHIIYSSCDYKTLAEDLLRLTSRYVVSKVQLFDMFPNTSHFETLVLLQRL